MKTKKENPIREDIRPSLIEKLTEILARTKITNNFFIDNSVFHELDEIENKFAKKPLGQLSQEYISDSPIIDFLFEELSEEIQATRKYDSKVEPLPLTEIEEYKDPSSLAERLVKDFESLPRNYKLFIKLPVLRLDKVLKTERLELSSALSLIKPSKEFSSIFPPPTYRSNRRPKLSSLLLPNEAKPKLDWQEHSVYCEITLKGFISIYEDTSPIKRANFLIRAFCGLALILQLFEIGYTLWVDEGYLKVYEENDGKWIAKKTRTLSSELTEGLEKLKLNEAYMPTEQLITARPKHILDELTRLFSNEQKNERLLRAAQWYFDSYCGDNELLSFVKATICLEMLLGEKKLSEKIGVMELIRTRCAYLIGVSHEDREQIEQDFSEIYKTRSNIVHNGQDRLTKLERDSLFKLRWLCARVIKKEIRITSES